jgi:hypothetical protein
MKEVAIMPEEPAEEREIQLDEDYEDTDYKIYFDKASLLNHITFLEDDNLFKIHLVQEDEQNVEKAQKKMKKSCQEMQLQIDDVQKNIDALNQAKELVHSKHVFLSGGPGKKKKMDSKVGSPTN